jgi:hypothetical protein
MLLEKDIVFALLSDMENRNNWKNNEESYSTGHSHRVS